MYQKTKQTGNRLIGCEGAAQAITVTKTITPRDSTLNAYCNNDIFEILPNASCEARNEIFLPVVVVVVVVALTMQKLRTVLLWLRAR